MTRSRWMIVLLIVGIVASVFVPVSVPGRARLRAAARAATTVRLRAGEARQLARQGRESVTATVADGLELSLWAPEVLLANPVALDFDEDGVAFVVATPRTALPLDIRDHPDWVPDVHAQRTTEDVRQFFRRVLAPERSGANTWLPDLNGDGSRDYRDLPVTKERIYRLEDTNKDGIADYSLLAFEGFNEDLASDIAGGVLVRGRDLIVTAAPDVWRLRDKNRDGVFEDASSISHGYSVHVAVSGHDLSTPRMGPDGRLYWKVGDIGLDVTDATGRRWSNPKSGAVLRSDPDGSNFEVFATGLRNTQEIAFDDHGNLIAVDNDGDYPGESERIVYITYGSDAGWRTTWQYGKYTDLSNNKYNVWMDEGLFKPRFDGQASYIVPPIALYRAGPSGFAYNPGTALSPEWQGQFFVTTFTGNPSTARVWAFKLNEQGAGFSYPGDREVLRGVLSPGLKFGPDGALYMTDWITGFDVTNRGRVWKLDAPGDADSRVRRDVRMLLTGATPWRGRPQVRELLRHADQRIRLAAQADLVERSDAKTLLEAARDTAYPLARLHGIWGLGQLARKDAQYAAELLPLLDERDAEVRAQAAKTLGDLRHGAAADRLVPLLRDESSRVRFFAAEALGRIRHRPAVSGLVEMLASNNDSDVYLRHAGSLALASIGDVGALRSLAGHPSRAVRLAAVVALRRLANAGVADFLADADERVVTEAARAINDEGGIVAALPDLARLLTDARFTGEPLLRRAVSANLRLGTVDAAERVTAFANRPGLAASLRTEALAALAVWAAPSPLDRVDGAYLGVAGSNRGQTGVKPGSDEGQTTSWVDNRELTNDSCFEALGRGLTPV